MTNFTARITKEEKHILVSFKANKVTLRNSEQINNYLNTKTNINNISCFYRVATIFNLEKTFDSFFNSNLAYIVNNLKFFELEYFLVEKLLVIPRHEATVICYRADGTVVKQKFVDFMTEWEVLDAANAWLDHKKDERKKHERVLLAKVQAAMKPIPIHM